MAKRKQTRRKTHAEPAPKSAFWPLTFAILLFVAALFVLLGSFRTGGPLPLLMFEAGYWAVGWAAYLVPGALVCLGAYMFVAEGHRVPVPRLVSGLGIILFTASWLFTALSTKQPDGTYVEGRGGVLGQLVGNMALSALDKFPASVMFLVFIALSVFFAFGISPVVLMGLFKIFKRRQSQDTDLSVLKARAESKGFELNEGVPIEHNGQHDKPLHLTTLKNTAEKLAPSENHEALTLASDPNWKLPPINLLDQRQDKADAGDVNANALAIRDTFANFSIDVEMEGANVGPRVTQYTLRPPTGVKLTKLTTLDNNLALDLAATSIRIEAPIPGKRAVGVEVPNVKPAIVRLSSVIQSREWAELKSPLGFCIGKDITGKPVVADLAQMPHMLVAGQTGSGKSVMINSILTSLLYRNSPSDLKLILVDPKQVELTPYDDLPHLLTPVIHEPEKCISALKWAVAEMERRLRTMAGVKKRNIGEYNDLMQQEGMPYIVIVIDELADLMMMAARDVESLVVRLAQKSRATGIHLVLATQRPSVDVITGLIKANVPARVAFTVAQQVDSRTIIDQIGAEKLLGMGDMLFLTSDMPKPKRIQGTYIAESEISKVNDFIRMQRPPQYNEEVISQPVQLSGRGSMVADIGNGDGTDDLWNDAVRVVIEGRKASTSLLQRRLRIGYGRAARLIEMMEEQGIVGPADGSRAREVLVNSIDEVFGGYDSIPDDDDTEEQSKPTRIQL